MQQAPPAIDRPPPGHYRGRLSTVLGALPAGDEQPWGAVEIRSPGASWCPQSDGGTGQLALPLGWARPEGRTQCPNSVLTG